MSVEECSSGLSRKFDKIQLSLLVTTHMLVDSHACCLSLCLNFIRRNLLSLTMASRPVPAVINDDDTVAPPPPRPQWRTLQTVYDTGFAESRASLRVNTDHGDSKCVKGGVWLQRYGDTLLFRLAYEGHDAPSGRINLEKKVRGCVYLPADDLVDWGIRMRIDTTSTGVDVQLIHMQFNSFLSADGFLDLKITIPLGDNNDETFFAGLIFADQERRRILGGR